MKSILCGALVILVAACRQNGGTEPRETVSALVAELGTDRITTSPAAYSGYLERIDVSEMHPLVVLVRSSTVPPLSRASLLAELSASTSLILLPASSETNASREFAVLPEWTADDVRQIETLLRAGGATIVATSAGSRSIMFTPPAGAQRRLALLVSLAGHPKFDFLSSTSSSGGNCRSLECQRQAVRPPRSQ